MSPRTKAQIEKIRDDRRKQIMNVALHLFATEGYAHCTIAMLAARTGISKGLMYHYFNSKEALLEAIIEEGLDEVMNLFDPNRDGVLTSREFIDFIRKVFAVMRSDKEFWVLYVSVIMQPRVKEHLTDKPIIRSIEQFLQILMEYFTRKGFDDPNLEVLTLSAMIEGLGILMVYTYPEMKFPDELLEKYEKRIIEMYQ
ncbi:MAG TPA: TetR/AcrR family transcriptional regulator [Bacteroides sp.]|nr:TetR/AcrR family transcriptional regulator [Bacteroides sp.]